MFGFPINSQSNDIQKFTNNADSGFPKIQQREVFYSIRDGFWDDRTVWQTASGRVGLLPTANDDVYIRNTIQIIGSATPFNCNNLFISGILSMANRVLNVYGNFKNIGIVNSGTAAGVGTNYSIIKLYGVENILGIINQNNGTDIQYARDGVQYIQPFNYYRLSTAGTGPKYLTSNTVVLENLVLTDVSPNYIGGVVNIGDDRLPIFECAGYELEVYGVTNIGQFAIFKQSGSGRLKFRGFVGVGFGIQYPGGFLLPGNPNVELQNGFYMSYDINLGYGSRGGLYSGTGTWTFTTNNQNIGTNVPSVPNFILDCPILIDAGITLTVSSPFTTPNSSLYLNNTINGVSSTSQLVNKSGLYFNTLTSVASMTTGIFDRTTFANTVGYTGNYTTTIPSAFTTFHNLTIAGTGIKTLGGNTTINGNLTCLVNSTLECSTFNLTVNGTTTVGGSSIASGLLSKNGAGNILFVGNVNSQVNGGGQRGLDFSGNPNVEFRNGLTFYSLVGVNTGTGTWTFSTVSQTINFLGINSTRFNCNILISGAINLTLIQGGGGPIITNINGNNAASRLINATGLRIDNNTGIMSTGLVDFNSNVNTVNYIVSGNYTIPNYSYYSLGVSGGGIKTLNQNTTLLGNLSVQDATLECSTFNLTVNGTTTIGSSGGNGTLSKNSSTGSLLFIGSFFLDNNTGFGIDFSGNPNVEFRGGITNFYNFTSINTGTGTFTFSTNNQTIVLSNAKTFNCNFLISGAITVTLNSSITSTFTGLLNGNNVGSTFRMGASSPAVNYQNATQPMAIGILDTSTNANTWIYGLNNQDIKGSPTISPKQVYRNLTLNGTGVKTLQGYVSVLNTYTLTAPATLANNGFTLTNP